MKSRTTDDLVRIALSGGALRIDAAPRTTEDLVRIALVVKSHGGRLTLFNTAGKTTDELVRIALSAKGFVEFEG